MEVEWYVSVKEKSIRYYATPQIFICFTYLCIDSYFYLSLFLQTQSTKYNFENEQLMHEFETRNE